MCEIWLRECLVVPSHAVGLGIDQLDSTGSCSSTRRTRERSEQVPALKKRAADRSVPIALVQLTRCRLDSDPTTALAL